MRLVAPPSTRKNPISLTPLIDVVFILLLFFMLSSSFQKWRQVNISAPASASIIIPDEHPEFAIVRLEQDGGRFKIGETSFELAKLAALKTYIDDHKKSIFVVDAAPHIQVQPMVSLVDALKQNGADKISLASVALSDTGSGGAP